MDKPLIVAALVFVGGGPVFGEPPSGGSLATLVIALLSALVVSFARIVREEARGRARGEPPTPRAAILGDVVLGVAGGAFAVFLGSVGATLGIGGKDQELTFNATVGLAMLGGTAGPALFDYALRLRFPGIALAPLDPKPTPPASEGGKNDATGNPDQPATGG